MEGIITSNDDENVKYYKKCPKCDEINEKEAKWCMECGKAISSVEVCRQHSFHETQHTDSRNDTQIPGNESYVKENVVYKEHNTHLRASFKNLQINQYQVYDGMTKNYTNGTTYDSNYHSQNNVQNCVNLEGYHAVNGRNMDREIHNIDREIQENIGELPPFYALYDPVTPIYPMNEPLIQCILPSPNMLVNVNRLPPIDENNQNVANFPNNRSDILKYNKRTFVKHKKWERRNKNAFVAVHPSKENTALSVLNLPEEIILYMFSFLRLSDLASCARVCKQFYRVASDESLWKVIHLRKRHDINDEILQSIARRHPSSITITHCNTKHITIQGLCKLLQTCSQSLEVLDVSGNSGGVFVGDVFLIHVSGRCENIHSLDVSWSNVGNKGVKSICHASKRLIQISLNGCQAITDQSIKAIAEKHFECLQILEVFGCFNITQTSINLIACKCKEIRVLNLGQCHKVKNAALSAIARGLPKLESLDIRGCKMVRDCALREIIVNCPLLSTLVIANCPSITDSTLITLASVCPQLRCLDVCGICKISDRGVEALAKSCRMMTSLDLSSTKATGKSVLAISGNCRQVLESLKLSFCHAITDVCLNAVVMNCKKLKCLHLYGCQPLTNLTKLMEIKPGLKIEV